MMKQRLRKIALPFLSLLSIGILSTNTISAQSRWLPDDLSPVQKKMVDEVGRGAVDYWNPKLNDYKRTIDRMLTPSDLDELNRLRVRWGILIGKMTEHVTEVENVDGEESELSLNLELGEGEEGDLMEIFEIWMKSVKLAQSYRSGLDELELQVVDDIGQFGNTMSVHVNNVIDANKVELSNDEKGEKLLSKQSEIVEKLANAGEGLKKKNKSFMKVYGMAIEPFILLFNGGDLRGLLSLASRQTSNADIEGVVGLLPASSLLQQNYPNPASSKTTIPFTLTQASSATTLRIYNSQGAIVKTIDLGSIDAGERRHELDVSDLANGSYLYHLTVKTSSGEMVYSKVMQIVR